MNEKCIILDGDILISRDDIGKFFINDDLIGITTNISSDSPVYADTNEDVVISFSRSESNRYEWACVCTANPAIFDDDRLYIYDTLKSILPCRYVEINRCEIDTPSDLRIGAEWIMKNMQ